MGVIPGQVQKESEREKAFRFPSYVSMRLVEHSVHIRGFSGEVGTSNITPSGSVKC